MMIIMTVLHICKILILMEITNSIILLGRGGGYNDFSGNNKYNCFDGFNKLYHVNGNIISIQIA